MSIKSVTIGAAVLAAVFASSIAAPSAQASAFDANGPSGHSNEVTIYSAYTGSGYQVWAEFTVTIARGHIDFRGPGGLRASSPDGPWSAGADTARFSGRGSGQLCAEGWSYRNGSWNSVGLPCVTI
jgi:opacity protein-like surface antigen